MLSFHQWYEYFRGIAPALLERCSVTLVTLKMFLGLGVKIATASR